MKSQTPIPQRIVERTYYCVYVILDTSPLSGQSLVPRYFFAVPSGSAYGLFTLVRSRRLFRACRWVPYNLPFVASRSFANQEVLI